MSEMIKPITYLSKAYCEYCKANTIECYNIYNKPIFYNNILYIRDKDILEQRLGKYPLSHMQCTRCRRKYVISWEDGVPTPLRAKFKLRKFSTKEEGLK